MNKNHNHHDHHIEPKIPNPNPHAHEAHGTAPTHQHGHQDASMAESFLQRFYIVSGLLIPLFIVSMAGQAILKYPDFPFRTYVELAFSTLIFSFSLVFFQHAWHEIRNLKPGMMSLVSLAVGSGYAFSLAATFVPSLEVEFHLEIATLIWVLLFGHYLEAKASRGAGNALDAVSKLLPKMVHRIKDGSVEDVEIEMLVVGDHVLVKPGEKIPADGIVIKGTALVNESHLTGESTPNIKNPQSKVVAGALIEDSSIEIEILAVGEHSTIGQMKTLIEKAQTTKPASELLADRAARILTISAVVIAIATLAVWLSLGQTVAFAMTLAITVLVIACPHALGLAIPTVSTIATEKAAKNGIFIKNLGKLEIVNRVNYVVFDKTGTLTEGKFGISEVHVVEGSEAEVLTIAASLEQFSSHMLAKAVVDAARTKQLKLLSLVDIKNHAGMGVSGQLGTEIIRVGNQILMEKNGINLPTQLKDNENITSGKTIMYVAKGEVLIGLIGLSDVIKPTAKAMIDKLHGNNIKVAMITGDNASVASQVANTLGIDTFFADVLPEDKYKYVKKLQEQGNKVAMVGDGVNDAPALTQADVGIAIGAGTDVAIEAGDIILAQSDPAVIPGLIVLGKQFVAKITQNLWWALGYNIIAIPAAAGVFMPWGFSLSPQIGAIAMALSSVVVVVNAQTLRRLTLR